MRIVCLTQRVVGGSAERIKAAENQRTAVKGGLLFTEGDPAEHFFIIPKGRVLLSRGEQGPTVYTARHGGELIGWSTLTGRDNFSASAKCLEPTSLLKFNRDRFLESLDKEPENAAILYKRLAETLGKRLIGVYPSAV